MGIFVNFWLFLPCPLPRYGDVMSLKFQISKKNYFVSILHLVLGKVTKFLVEISLLQKLSAKNVTGVENTPSIAFRVKGVIVF